MVLEISIYGIAAFLITWGLTLVLIGRAAELGLVDHPVGRKNHESPTPVVGGVAMLVAVTVLAMTVMPSPKLMLGFSLAALVILVSGWLDDMKDLRWFWRIGAQSVAALIMIYVGGVQIEQIGPLFGLRPMALGDLSVPFTVFATVGVINAVNMADGIDGLAGSIVFATLLMLGAAAVYSGNNAMLPLLSAMVGAVAAFLWFNVRRPGQPKARTFMGNAGSAFLGFVIAWFSFRLTQSAGHPVSPVLAPFLIALPVVDCLALIVRRLKEGRSPFSADRGHLHHLMIDAGFTPSQVVATVVAISLAIGLVAALALMGDLPHPLFVVGFLALLVLHFWITVSRLRAISFFSILHRLIFQSVAHNPSAQKSTLPP